MMSDFDPDVPNCGGSYTLGTACDACRGCASLRLMLAIERRDQAKFALTLLATAEAKARTARLHALAGRGAEAETAMLQCVALLQRAGVDPAQYAARERNGMIQ